jgi:hypothetical protein
MTVAFRRSIVAGLLLAAAVSLSAQSSPAPGPSRVILDFSAALSGGTADPALDMFGGLSYVAPGWEVFGRMEASNADQFGQVAAGPYLEGIWARFVEAGLAWKTGPFSFAAGRFPNRDEIASPYSLFINSLGHPATMLDFRYDDGFFFYETRWVQLNVHSKFESTLPTNPGLYGSTTSFDWPDRGMQYKVYGFNLGSWRFGYQDSAVYLRPEPAFDFDNWLIPYPGFFIQYMDANGGAPWGRRQNDNAIMGLFAAYDDGLWSGSAQLLVDDINLDRWFDRTGGRLIPDKLGFAAGAGWASPFGRFRFDLAAVTKYTYESIGIAEQDQYPYTYYHDTRFGSAKTPISIEEMMIGFKYGENSGACRLGYDLALPWFDLSTALELVVAGDRSPANPWHDLTSVPDYTEWLDSALLDTTAAFSAAAERTFVLPGGGELSGEAAVRLGGHWNPSALRAPAASDNEDDDWIWSPAAGFEPIAVFSLTGKIRLGFVRGALVRP